MKKEQCLQCGVIQPTLHAPHCTENPDNQNPLTPAQTRVLQLSAEGYSCSDAAMMLGIAVDTVKHHRYTLMQRLDAENIANAVYIGLKTAIIV